MFSRGGQARRSRAKRPRPERDASARACWIRARTDSYVPSRLHSKEKTSPKLAQKRKTSSSAMGVRRREVACPRREWRFAFRSLISRYVSSRIWTMESSNDSHVSRGSPEHARSSSPRHQSRPNSNTNGNSKSLLALEVTHCSGGGRFAGCSSETRSASEAARKSLQGKEICARGSSHEQVSLEVARVARRARDARETRGVRGSRQLRTLWSGGGGRETLVVSLFFAAATGYPRRVSRERQSSGGPERYRLKTESRRANGIKTSCSTGTDLRPKEQKVPVLAAEKVCGFWGRVCEFLFVCFR